jgi:pSer/pThr/pTyr-binding forkhead associated (FHA) protein
VVQQGASARPWPFASEVLAERLVVGGYLQKPVADTLIAEASAKGASLVDVIREHKQLAPDALRDAMSRIFGLPVANLASIHVDPTLIASFPSDFARKHMLLPLHREGDKLLMVVADPTQAEAIRHVRRTVGLTIDLRLASLDDLAPVVHKYFSAHLVALLPSGETLDIILPHGELKIGRADHNEIVLPDPTVGSSHAILRALGDGYHIVDFGSRNGVFVDGKKINNSQQLKNGDVIQIGQCLLTFKLPLPEAAQSHDGATQILTPDKIGVQRPIIQSGGSIGSPYPQPAANLGGAVAAVGVPVVDDKKDKKKKKGGKKDEKGKDEKMKSAWIGFASRIIAQVLGAVATIVLGLAVAGKLPSCGTAETSGLKQPADVEPVTSMLFPERVVVEGKEDVHNISGIVPIGDGRFLFADNNFGDALFELTLGPDGAKSGPIVRRPLAGLPANVADDIEALTVAEKDGRRYVIATTSLYKKESKKTGEFGDKPSALIRASINPDGSLSAEAIPNFRDWFSKNVPDIGNAAILEPDQGGLNVEGLAWDPSKGRLLFGIRTPVKNGAPIVVPVKVLDLTGAWIGENLAAEPSIKLAIEDTGDEEGIRGLEYDPSRSAYLVIVGNSTSVSKAPFQLYEWDGNAEGKTKRFAKVWFDKKIKAESVAHATFGDKGAVVVADDAGGYVVLWDSDPRLQLQ